MNHATICGHCQGFMAGNPELLHRCVIGAQIDVAGPCERCQPGRAATLSVAFLTESATRHLQSFARHMTAGLRPEAERELLAADRVQNELMTLFPRTSC